MRHGDGTGLRLETSLVLPRDEHGFHDALYEWMGRAPWLAVSAAAHLLVFFVLAAIPWEEFRREEVKEILVSPEAPAEDLLDEPVEMPEEIVPKPLDEPRLVDAGVPVEVEADPAASGGDFLDLDPADARADVRGDVFGIGAGAFPGGKLGERFGDRSGALPAGKGIERALGDGLEWLAAHQAPDGSWDADGFAAGCGAIGPSTCGGPGVPQHDVGVTSLALLAFLGEGNTTQEGRYQDVVADGVRWLRQRQDPDSGLVGERASRDFLYDHGVASLVLCEAYYFSHSPLLKLSAQRAVDFVQAARNPYGAWRYDVPPIGENDTSVTGWMVLALTSARDAGLAVDPAAFDGALSWIDEVTDPATGRVGYDAPGSPSSRTKANDHFSPEKGEAMTAVGLLCRFFLGETPDDVSVMRRHADVLLRTLPAWDVEGFGCDMYYWYYGSYAMFQLGGEPWERWRDAMEPAVLGSQRRDGDEKGSWDPVGPWGYVGGRVYSTALMVLCLEVYFRYDRVLGAR